MSHFQHHHLSPADSSAPSRLILPYQQQGPFCVKTLAVATMDGSASPALAKQDHTLAGAIRSELLAPSDMKYPASYAHTEPLTTPHTVTVLAATVLLLYYVAFSDSEPTSTEHNIPMCVTCETPPRIIPPVHAFAVGCWRVAFSSQCFVLSICEIPCSCVPTPLSGDGCWGAGWCTLGPWLLRSSRTWMTCELGCDTWIPPRSVELTPLGRNRECPRAFTFVG